MARWGIWAFVPLAVFAPVLGAQGASTSSVTATDAPAAVSQIPPRSRVNQVNPELESKLVGDFANNDCERVRESVNPGLFPEMTPLVLAVVAYCEPRGQDPEKLFEEAESKGPSDELIALLHARYRWHKDPATAEPLWRKVLLLARDPVVRRLAEDYLEGNASGEEPTFIGKKWSYYLGAELSAGHETNPATASVSELRQPSNATYFQLSAGATHDMARSSLAINYNLLGSVYSHLSSSDFFEHDMDLPWTFRVGRSEDLVIRPFFSHLSLGQVPYQVLGGLAVQGVAYRSTYKQSVQGAVYRDHYSIDVIRPEQGTHFRFEYDWEFYPRNFWLRALTYIEHVAASSDVDVDPDFPINIPYSHTDFGIQAFADYDLGWMILGLYPRFKFREDSGESSYLNTTGSLATKRRQDQQVAVRFNLVVPVSSTFQLVSWYEWNRTFSNIGPQDYVDRNSLDQTYALGLRIFLTSYR